MFWGTHEPGQVTPTEPGYIFIFGKEQTPLFHFKQKGSGKGFWLWGSLTLIEIGTKIANPDFLSFSKRHKSTVVRGVVTCQSNIGKLSFGRALCAANIVVYRYGSSFPSRLLDLQLHFRLARTIMHARHKKRHSRQQWTDLARGGGGRSLGSSNWVTNFFN